MPLGSLALMLIGRLALMLIWYLALMLLGHLALMLLWSRATEPVQELGFKTDGFVARS